MKKLVILFVLCFAMSYSQHKFSFDSLALADSINDLGKANAIYKKIYKAGRQYTFKLTNTDTQFYHSDELQSLSIHGSRGLFRYMTVEDLHGDHNPGIPLTSNNTVQAIQQLQPGQPFTLQLKMIPSKYKHKSNRAATCQHEYNGTLCKIVSVTIN